MLTAPIKIGFIEDFTGDLSIYGIAKKHAAELAIKEINSGLTLIGGQIGAPGKATFAKRLDTVPKISCRSGDLSILGKQGKFSAECILYAEEDKIICQSNDIGVLGRSMELVPLDSKSELSIIPKLAETLILSKSVDVIFGGFTSSAREKIRPVINKYKQLYFYSNQYEGGVADKTTFCTGAVTEQQILPLLQYMINNHGPRIYVIAANYNFGRLTAEWTKLYAPLFGGEVVGDEYVNLGVSGFSDTIKRVKNNSPDWVLTLIIGKAQQNYYPQALAANLNFPMASTVNMAQGYEHLRFIPPALNNMHNAVNYMMEIPTNRNIAFVKRWFNHFPEDVYVGQMAQNTYFSIHLYAKAVRMAETAEQKEVIKTLESGLHIEAPEGSIFLDPSTHHVTHHIRLAKADENHRISFVQEWPNCQPWWLKRLGVNLVREHEHKQYIPADEFNRY